MSNPIQSAREWLLLALQNEEHGTRPDPYTVECLRKALAELDRARRAA